ncbi:hypothetical protein KAU19_08100 [Candidatus Parcubacteria bacterium]|nr:hypothetical protein [Candidatus Parcubacteria bacterium]
MTINLKNQIVEILKSNSDCRNSDITLTIEIWKQFYESKITITVNKFPCVALKDLYDLPREDNIKRIRAKLSEEALNRISTGQIEGDEHFYLPTSGKVAYQRQISQALWQKALGYFKRATPTQTTQLPRPVGKLGFSIIDDYNFIAQGADNKRYKVTLTPDGLWRCECDSYRFSDKVKQCKHIKEIIAYKKAIEQEKRAKSQSLLF